MKYPFYTRDSAYWYAYHSDQKRVLLHDGWTGDTSIESEDATGHPSIRYAPGKGEESTTKAAFNAAFKRISQRLGLLAEGKSDDHLVDRGERPAYKA